MPTILPTKYYLTHARELFGFVQNECSHLLEHSHNEYLDTFKLLSEDAQCLLVRCLTRKPRFIKKTTLVYDEIDNLPSAINELDRHGYLGKVNATHWPEFAHILTKPNLLKALQESQYPASQATSKVELIELAHDYVELNTNYIDSLFDQFIVRRKNTVFDYIRFLFFGDLSHRFQKFTMRDLGVLKTRKPTGKLVARFAHKSEALSTFALQQQRYQFMSNPELMRQTIAEELLHMRAIGQSAIEIKDNLLLAVGNSLVADKPDKAIELWRASQHSKATEKWIRETYKHNKSDLKEELESLRTTKLDAATRVFIEDFYARKYQGKRTSIYTDILRESPQSLAIDEAYLNEVEDGVMQYYRQQGAEVFFTENALWRVLFAFTFWELLFGQQHLQHSEFDKLPIQLSNNTFYHTFQTDIERCLAQLNSKTATLQNFTKLATTQYGKPTGLFYWSASLLDAIVPCIRYSPKGAIATVLKRMAQDYRNTKDGYPDLMVVRNKQIQFEEIKAPGDTLRPNQLVSINRLRRAGLQVSVTQIDWAINPHQVYAVVDIETTGSSHSRGNAITEIAVVKVCNRQVVSEWSSLVNPCRHIPANITQLTGIDNEMVASAPLFAEIASELSAQLDGCIFVAHNVGFDYGFIKAAYAECGLTFRKPKYCTVKNSRKTFPGLKSYSLSSLTGYFDIDLAGAHRALNDARATADLLRLIQEEQQRNKNSK